MIMAQEHVVEFAEGLRRQRGPRQLAQPRGTRRIFPSRRIKWRIGKQSHAAKLHKRRRSTEVGNFNSLGIHTFN